jgi:hypothetical protein
VTFGILANARIASIQVLCVPTIPSGRWLGRGPFTRPSRVNDPLTVEGLRTSITGRWGGRGSGLGLWALPPAALIVR